MRISAFFREIFTLLTHFVFVILYVIPIICMVFYLVYITEPFHSI